MMDAHGYRFRLRWHGMTEATREVAHQYGPVLLSSVVASGGLLVDQSMAAMLPAGSVSALVYANRFVSVVLTLAGGSGFNGGDALLLAHDRASGLGRMPAHAAHMGAADGAGFSADCGGADCGRAPADPRDIAAWRLWSRTIRQW